MHKEVQNMDHQLLADIKQMIEHTRQTVSQTVNAGLTLLYWNIGRRINDELLDELRAECGQYQSGRICHPIPAAGLAETKTPPICPFQ